MEDTELYNPLSGAQFISHCCDDVVIYYGIDSSYTPSFSFIPDSYQNNIQVYSYLAGLPVNSVSFTKPIYTSAGPPDELMSTSVDLSEICIFRI
jgi:hypothetical protein